MSDVQVQARLEAVEQQLQAMMIQIDAVRRQVAGLLVDMLVKPEGEDTPTTGPQFYNGEVPHGNRPRAAGTRKV